MNLEIQVIKFKYFYIVLMFLLFSFDGIAQISVLNKNGGFTSDALQAVDQYGGIGSGKGINRFGGIVDAALTSDVIIGTQTWQATNLDVTTYRDGTLIPQVTNVDTWKGLTTGAWCYYDNVTDNGTTYGKLYNWYAVAGIYDEASKTDLTLRKQLAPTGWNIPTNAQWTILSDYLGGKTVAGGKMKAVGTTFWSSPNTGADNTSGFTALPGGYRNPINGAFSIIHLGGNWWSSSEFSITNAYNRQLDYTSTALNYGTSNMAFGNSVRCVKGIPAAVGDYRDGGVVFWVNPANNTQGLVCAIEDQSSGIRWYNGSVINVGTGNAIGTGSANTAAIISSQGETATDYAAGLARAYNGGGFTDWYLPSRDELSELRLNKSTIGGFSTNFYWSSSQQEPGYAWYKGFDFGYQNGNMTSNLSGIRAVRAF